MAKVYVGITAGQFYMGMGNSNNYFPFSYGGAGVGAGVGFNPVGGSVALPSFPSTGGEWGRLYKVPQSVGWGATEKIDVNIDTIAGPAVLVVPSATFSGVGGSLSFIMFGAGGGFTNVLSPAGIMGGCKAVAFQAGSAFDVPDVQAGCTLYRVQILSAGKMKKM